MRTRLLLGAAGVAVALWGVWLLRDDGFESLRSLATWLVAGVVLHDGVIAPLTVAVAALAGRVLPAPARVPVLVGVAVWAICTIAFFPVLSGEGVKPDNPTLLPRDYRTSWLVLTALLILITVVVAIVRARRAARRPARATDGA